MGRAVRVAFQRDRRHGDVWSCGELLLQFVVLRLTWCHSEAPPVVVDHDVDVIGVVERRRASIKRLVVKARSRGRGVPDELREVVAVLVVARSTTICCEVEL